jgi:hypothetical protein
LQQRQPALTDQAITMTSSFDTPVLLIIFSNPRTTRKTFEQIRLARPTRLYIAADGPRPNVVGEAELAREVRCIVNDVDWPCEVKTFFREENSGGAGPGVYAALDWFFSEVEEGIVLEYDCIPHPDFFPYCAELLERYRNDDKVMVIGGDNLQDGLVRGDASYYFSPSPYTWGWASWRRTWRKYVYDLGQINKSDFVKAIPFAKMDKEIERYWRWVLYLMQTGRIDTWDYQLMFAVWLSGGTCINPNINLVTHSVAEGGESGTYFLTHQPGTTNVPTAPILPLVHPKAVVSDEDAYFYHCKKYRLGMSMKKLAHQIARLYIPDSLVNHVKKLFPIKS